MWRCIRDLFQSLLCWIMVCKLQLGMLPKAIYFEFQSLLCWIMVCKDILGNRWLNTPWFQSLLCWIMVCKPFVTGRRMAAAKCFNPCYVGLWSVSGEVHHIHIVHAKFQSLLCWIMVCKMVLGERSCYVAKFQSLLCWIMVCKRLGFSPDADVSGFQSLLCWIMVCKRYFLFLVTDELLVSILVMLDYGL